MCREKEDAIALRMRERGTTLHVSFQQKMAGGLKERLGLTEVKAGIWKPLLAEFLGNLLLNLFGCASCVNVVGEPVDLVLIALTFGLVIMAVVQVNTPLWHSLVGLPCGTKSCSRTVTRTRLISPHAQTATEQSQTRANMARGPGCREWVMSTLSGGHYPINGDDSSRYSTPPVQGSSNMHSRREYPDRTVGHVSGGHVNPAVTCGMLVTGNISVLKALLYIIVQCLGALAGSAVLKALTPEKVQGTLGLTVLSPGVTSIQGFGIEFFLGFVLLIVVFGVCDGNRNDTKGFAPLAIGLTITMGHLAAVSTYHVSWGKALGMDGHPTGWVLYDDNRIHVRQIGLGSPGPVERTALACPLLLQIDYTGSSMNPARTLGSAIIANTWDDHWVYWLGPILGGMSASLIYKHALSAPVPEVSEYSPVQVLQMIDSKEVAHPI
uniref:(California timema) hypothetical protein n=1 Tax=Timema californicum TaxID=61474 RepID=A0A7R9JIY4_TIMCA|nr:unnamed protein product [Timema californicum]